MGVDRTSYEQLSAFIDGDLVSGAGSFAKRLSGNPELSAGWRRYHFIGDCLRGEGPALNTRFTDSLLARIAEEPTVLAPRARQAPVSRDMRWSRWAAGGAIAASVAAVIVIGVARLDNPAGQFVPQQAPVPAPALAGRGAVEEAAAPAAQQPEVVSKLNRYLANHSDFASRGSLNGMTPLATFVSYDE